jgi:hypothetical protein
MARFPATWIIRNIELLANNQSDADDQQDQLGEDQGDGETGAAGSTARIGSGDQRSGQLGGHPRPATGRTRSRNQLGRHDQGDAETGEARRRGRLTSPETGDADSSARQKPAMHGSWRPARRGSPETMARGRVRRSPGERSAHRAGTPAHCPGRSLPTQRA